MGRLRRTIFMRYISDNRRRKNEIIVYLLIIQNSQDESGFFLKKLKECLLIEDLTIKESTLIK